MQTGSLHMLHPLKLTGAVLAGTLAAATMTTAQEFISIGTRGVTGV